MQLDGRQTLVLAILTLFLGKFLNKHVPFFREYNIPEPVTGGVLASLLFGAIYFSSGFAFEFDLNGRDTLLLVFFTSIGLSSGLETLLKGGKPLLILLVLSIGYLFLQNFIGIGVTYFTGLPPQLGLVGGSISLSGGHGTAIAWAPTLAAEYQLENVSEIGIACATFGLVLGGLIGGPIAKRLITRHRLEPPTIEEPTVGIAHYEEQNVVINYDYMIRVILVISVAIGIGIHLNLLLARFGLSLPDFVTCLFAGIILTNTLPRLFPKMIWREGGPSLALVSEISLGLFLAMSLMSLQLWTLVDLAGPILLILAGQLFGIVLYSTLIVFRAMGKNYDAAVMASGYAGLALGATPTAIANMTAVTKRFGASPLAFIVVPLIGAFFIDIANALIIKLLLSWL